MYAWHNVGNQKQSFFILKPHSRLNANGSDDGLKVLTARKVGCHIWTGFDIIECMVLAGRHPGSLSVVVHAASNPTFPGGQSGRGARSLLVGLINPQRLHGLSSTAD